MLRCYFQLVIQMQPWELREFLAIEKDLVPAERFGFLLPSLFGAIKDRTGEYGVGLFIFAIAFFVASVLLLCCFCYAGQHGRAIGTRRSRIVQVFFSFAVLRET